MSDPVVICSVAHVRQQFGQLQKQHSHLYSFPFIRFGQFEKQRFILIRQQRILLIR